MKAKNDENFSILLHKNGLKVTPLRLGILELLKHQQSPLTTEEISGKLKNIEFDRATVFRNLKIFTENEILKSVDLGEGFLRYELSCDRHEHHHHVMCTSCKKIEIIPFCVPAQITTHLKKVGYSNLTHRMDFFGICENCL